MPHILLSYRREDSAAYAGRLADRLREHFGTDHVFMDIDTIKLGEDFVLAIETSVQSCDVVIAVIGRNWATAADGAGRRRLARADDFVRLEIATALRRNIRVVPALVGGAVLPEAQDLPDDLAPLARRQALEISDGRFHYDVDRLIQALSETPTVSARGPAGPSTSSHTPPQKESRSVSRGAVVAAGIVALALVAAAYWGPAAWQSMVGRRSLGVEESAFDPRSAEQPQRVSLDIVHKISLAANQEMYFQLAAPGRDFRVVLDGRCITVTACSMNTALSVFDASGVVLEGATTHVIAYDVAFRRMLAVSLPAAGRIRVKLVNQSKNTLDYWLTVAGPETLATVPYFGTLAPGPLQVGDEARGVLGPGSAAAYSLRLKPGKYVATMDFSVAPRGAESLGGAVAVFNTAAGEESTPVYIIHYGVSVRNSGPLSIPAEGVYLFRVQNQRDTAVNYIFTLTGG